MTKRITGAEAIFRGLLAEGVDTVFGYPGGAILPVYDKLYDYTDCLRHILARHEQGAIHAAQGYARVSGKTGVVIVTSGPAASNVVTGLADAYADSTPLVVITGQVAVNFLGSDAFQEIDVVGITQPITKWTHQVRRAEDLNEALARAFYIASTGRPGPVVLDIAKDAQLGLTDDNYTPCRYIRSYNPNPVVSGDDLERAAALINSSRCPMILSGHGVMISQAEDELRRLAEKAEIPVACTLLGLSTIPSDHRLYMGMLGMHGNVAPNVNTNRADLIVAVGMRFDDRVTGDASRYAPDARIIHIDIDSSEFDKNVTADVHIHGDAREVLAGLLPLVDKASHKVWLNSFERHAEVERQKVSCAATAPGDPDGPMKMGEVASKVSAATGDRAVLVTDVGQNQMFSSRYFRFTESRSIITSGGLGTMGFGLPAAIGAKLAAPERTVCLFTGDGGLQMTVQELGTIMEYHADVKIILLNNRFLGNVRQWQELFFKSRFSQTPLLNPRFDLIAEAYGVGYRRVAVSGELDAGIAAMLSHDGAFLLDVNIDETDKVFPMTPVGGAVDTIMLNPTEKYQPDNG